MELRIGDYSKTEKYIENENIESIVPNEGNQQSVERIDAFRTEELGLKEKTRIGF